MKEQELKNLHLSIAFDKLLGVIKQLAKLNMQKTDPNWSG